jgi:hypothetical protein
MNTWLGFGPEDEELVRGFMMKVRRLPIGGAAPGGPQVLWWKAQLLRRWDDERRVQAPLEVMERLEILAGVAAAVLLLSWGLPPLARIVGGTLLGGAG